MNDNDTKASSPNSVAVGQSVESKAQKHDSATLSSPSIAVTSGSALRLYRLVPMAAANDPGWDNAPSHGEILVCAESPADARIVAAGRELDFMDIDSAPAEDVTTVNASAFRNEKLYTAILGGVPEAGTLRGVVKGVVRTDTIAPMKTDTV